MRRFVKGDPGLIGEVAARLTGSADLYQARGHRPINSVNFITCHDGFTLADLVSYDSKHNWANGEDNRDGNDDNMSWNCGVEGPTDDPAVLALRARQLRNFATLLMLSRGVPMLVAGDEIGRTQQGNNNAYCQDNEIGWFDWDLVEANQDLLRFWTRLLGFRRNHSVLRRREFYTGLPNDRGSPTSRGTAPTSRRPTGTTPTHGRWPARSTARCEVLMNMYWDPLEFQLPPFPAAAGRGRSTPPCRDRDDIAEPGTEQPIDASTYLVSGRSIVVLVSRPV